MGCAQVSSTNLARTDPSLAPCAALVTHELSIEQQRESDALFKKDQQGRLLIEDVDTLQYSTTTAMLLASATSEGRRKLRML